MFWAKWLVIIASYKKMYFLKKENIYEKRHVVNYWILALYQAWLVTREMQVVVVVIVIVVIVVIVVLVIIVVVVEVLLVSSSSMVVVY